MSSTMADLVVRVNADVHGLTSGMAKARSEVGGLHREAEKANRSLSSSLKSRASMVGSGVSSIVKGDPKSGINDIGGAFGGKAAGAVAGIAVVAAVVGGLYLVAQKSIDKLGELGGSLGTLGRQTGLTGDALTGFYGQLRMTGTDPEAAGAALGKFSKALVDARAGGPSLAVFERLGVDVRNANGEVRDGNTVLAESRTALSRVADTYDRNASAQALLGKGYKSMGKWIGASAQDIKQFNTIVSESGFMWGPKQKKDFATFVRSQREMSLRWDLMWASIGQKIIPLLNKMMKKYIAPAITRFEKFISLIGSIPGLVPAVKGAFDMMFGPIFDAVAAFDKMMKAIDQIKSGSPKAQTMTMDALKSLYSTIPFFSEIQGGVSKLPGVGSLPGFASGGIASGPSSGYLAFLHGTEKVTPMNGRSSGSALVVHVNIANLNGTDERAARQHAEMLGRHLSRGVMRQLVGQNV